MSDNYVLLLELLRGSSDWVSATNLAERLGVSTRSVRNYVAAAKSAARPFEIIAASGQGYRINKDQYQQYLATQTAAPDETPSLPRERAHHIIRRLVESSHGVLLSDLARSMHVSDATAELDLKRAREIALESDLQIDRVDGLLTFRGNEAGLRKVLSSLIYDSLQSEFLNLDAIAARFDIPELVAFKTDLIGRLDYHGYIINEYGIDSVLLHVAIAVDRVRLGQTLPDYRGAIDPDTTFVAGLVKELAGRHFGLDLGQWEETYLARQLVTRVMSVANDTTMAGARADAADRATLVKIVDLVYEEYLIDLRNDELIDRLSLHLGHLVNRAKFDVFSRNPLAKSIKTAYPLIFDVAVFMSSIIQKERGIVVDEDEISYVALHIGSYLERQAQRENRVSATIVCPSYYDLHIVMRESIEKILGTEISIESVITRTDVRMDEIDTDIVISTIPLAATIDAVIEVQPFLSDNDIDRVRSHVSRIRQQRRRSSIRERLMTYFRPELFFRNVTIETPEDMIRGLGEALKSLNVVDDAYIDGAIERERMSSTVFVDGLAVPHAMSMTAERPTIAIAVNENPAPWGEHRVNIVAFIAFAASGRDEFQTVFEQFVQVFGDRARMNEVIKGSTSFEGFIESLVHVIDA